jgi:hypothetical protein
LQSASPWPWIGEAALYTLSLASGTKANNHYGFDLIVENGTE